MSEQPDSGERSTVRLYRATLGDVSAERYLPAFARFDDQGMAGPTWNSAAALFHLGWLLHHRLWLSLTGFAVLATTVALAVLGLWHWAPGWPTGIKLGASLAMGLAALLVPGLWGTAWLHTRTRRRMIAAVERAATVDGACEVLTAEARDRQRRNTWGLAGLLSVVALTALLWQTVPWSSFVEEAPPALPEPEPEPASKPKPDPVAAVESVSPPLSPLPEVAAEKATSGVPPEGQSGEAALPAVSQVAATPDRLPDPLPLDKPEAVVRAAVPVGSGKPPKPPGASTAASDTDAAVSTAVKGGPSSAKALPKMGGRASVVQGATASSASSPVTPAADDAGMVGIRPRVKGFGVAVGMFSVTDNAERVAAQLSGAGLPVLSDPVDSARGRLTRVRVGPFERRAQAEAAAVKVKALGLEARVYTP